MIVAIIVVFTVLVAISMPIAVATGLAVTVGIALFSNFPLNIVFQKMVTGIDSFVLVAIPFFILTGNLMNAGGITDRIFTFVRRLIGHFRGGVAHANVGASVLFAGMSGSAIADAGGLGAIEIRAMRAQGYRTDFAAAVTAASSVIGPIIPPSIPFIIYGTIAEVSVGRLFFAGIVPGALIALALFATVAIINVFEGLPADPRSTVRERWRSFLNAFFALLTPVLILVGLRFGVFTPTEAGAVAAAYALFISLFVYRTLRLRNLPRILIETMVTTAIVTFMISTVSSFSWVLAIEQAGAALTGAINAITDNPAVILLILNAALLVLGALIEAGAVLILMTPILLPMVVAAGIDPVHFGVIIVLNLMIGVATPPVGMSLFVLSHVAKIPVEQVMRAVLPFLVPLIATLLVVSYLPALSLYLPSLLFD